MSNNASEIGLIGLAVMGQNLALNIGLDLKSTIAHLKTSRFLESNTQ